MAFAPHERQTLKKPPHGCTPFAISVADHRGAKAAGADETLMALTTGSRLGPYEILSPFGSGGMGEVYDILPGRGFYEAASLVGADYDGWLTHDGWAVYYEVSESGPSRLHLIRRCRDMAAVATPAAARFPRRVKAVLEEGLALRDRYHR